MLLEVPHIVSGGHTLCGPRWSLEQPEYTDAHRIYLIREGGAMIHRNERPCELKPGRVYLIPAYSHLLRSCPGRMRVDWLHFQLSDLHLDTRLSELADIRVWGRSVWRRWDATFASAERHIAQPDAVSQMRLGAMLLELLADCVGSDMERNDDAKSNWRQRLLPAVRAMDENFKRRPDLDTIARTVHLSPAHFHRRFCETFGLTPRLYMERLRMRTAASMLKSGRTNVSQTADELGYTNIFYFSRAFRRFHGYPPSQAGSAARRIVP